MRTFFSFIITVIIIPLVIATTLLWVTYSLIINPNFAKNLVKDQNTYQKIIDSSLSLIKFPDSQNEKFALTKDEQLRIIEFSVSPIELDQTIDATIDDFYAWAKGSNTFIRPINLIPHRDEAIKELNSVFKEKYSTLPECSASELILAQVNFENSFPTCRKASQNKYESRYENFDPTPFSENTLQDIPKAITFTAPDSISVIPATIHYFTIGLSILTAITLLLILILILLLKKWPKRLTRWLGIIGIITSVPILIPSYFGVDALQQELNSNINLSQSTPVQIKDLFTQIINSFVNQYASRINFVALIIFVIALVLIIISFFVGAKTKKTATPSDSPEENPSNPNNQI